MTSWRLTLAMLLTLGETMNPVDELMEADPPAPQPEPERSSP